MECPVCGRTTDNLVGGRCAVCRSQQEPFLDMPEVLDVTTCAHCGKLQRGTGWAEVRGDPKGAALMALQAAVELEPGLVDAQTEHELRWEDAKNATATTRLAASYEGNPVERSAETRLRMKTGVCQDCSRRFGGYFEAIVQLRTSEASAPRDTIERMSTWLDREVGRLSQEGRRGAFFSRQEKVRGGYDYFVGSHEIARILGRSLADHWGAEYGESTKLVGRREGADLYRVTILVRLPKYAPGDFVQVDGRAYKVLTFDKRLVILWDLERGERVRREYKRLRSVRRIGSPGDEYEAVIVSRHRTSIQLLHPVTLQTLDVEAQAPDQAQSVRIFRWNEETFVLPAEAQRLQTRQ